MWQIEGTWGDERALPILTETSQCNLGCRLTAPVLLNSPTVGHPPSEEEWTSPVNGFPELQDVHIFFCTKNISQRTRNLAYIVKKIDTLQKDSIVKYTANAVYDAMENWPVTCMPHVTVLDLWRLLDSFLYNLKEDMVAVDHDSTNVKVRTYNLLDLQLKRTLKYFQYHAQSQRKGTLKSMVEKTAKAKRSIFGTLWNSWNI